MTSAIKRCMPVRCTPIKWTPIRYTSYSRTSYSRISYGRALYSVRLTVVQRLRISLLPRHSDRSLLHSTFYIFQYYIIRISREYIRIQGTFYQIPEILFIKFKLKNVYFGNVYANLERGIRIRSFHLLTLLNNRSFLKESLSNPLIKPYKVFNIRSYFHLYS